MATEPDAQTRFFLTSGPPGKQAYVAIPTREIPRGDYTVPRSFGNTFLELSRNELDKFDNQINPEWAPWFLWDYNSVVRLPASRRGDAVIARVPNTGGRFDNASEVLVPPGLFIEDGGTTFGRRPNAARASLSCKRVYDEADGIAVLPALRDSLDNTFAFEATPAGFDPASIAKQTLAPSRAVGIRPRQQDNTVDPVKAPKQAGTRIHQARDVKGPDSPSK